MPKEQDAPLDTILCFAVSLPRACDADLGEADPEPLVAPRGWPETQRGRQPWRGSPEGPALSFFVEGGEKVHGKPAT